MVDQPAGIDVGVRVRQFYSTYLDSLYEVEYYRRMRTEVVSYARHLDFVIALGAAIGGGSGLGILASDWMAVPCGIMTAVAVVTTAAKQAYNWPAKIEFASEMMQKFSAISSECRRLFEDLQATRLWHAEFEKSFGDIRNKVSGVQPDPFPLLQDSVRTEIQEQIIRQENPGRWWKPASGSSGLTRAEAEGGLVTGNAVGGA